MKQNSTLTVNRFIAALLTGLIVLVSAKPSFSQITLLLGNPANHIYGLTSNGEIYEINTSTAATTKTIKNNSYSGKSPSSSNGLAYNSSNGQFYYFKRNVTSSPQEFVSFNPLLNIVTPLAASTCSDDIHTGCISNNGKGYYTIDIQGNLNYYNIVTNAWTKITSTIVDNFGADVDNVIRTQSAGDIAIDGNGNLFILTSSNTNYGLYKVQAPLPTSSVASLNVTRIIAPTATTPTGNSFAGIAFNSNGQIFMGTRGDDRLYLLQNSSTLTYIAKFSSSDAGNDLTSLNFPLVSVLPVKWISFNASVKDNEKVNLEWKVMEQQNKGFYIQYSTDGSNWKDIGFIKSRNNPETEETYSYSHAANFSGKQYYRIKQVDIDGKESLSVIRSLSFTANNSNLAVWPNPARNVINVENEGSKSNVIAKAQVYDLSGKLSMEKQLQQGLNSIDISFLAPGAYIIKANTNKGDSFTQKIIKQ